MNFFFILYLWLLMASKTPLNKIARSNQLIKEAEISFLNKNYILALVKYRYLNNSMHIQDNRIQLNLAHCYFINKDTAQAKRYYLNFANAPSQSFRSVACQQLGVLAFEQQEYRSAVNYFKKALQAKPESDAIRFNYELAKRMALKNPESGKKKNKKPSRKPEEKPKESVHQPQQQNEPDNEQKSRQEKKIEDRLKNINLSQEKAQMILDAMKNSEIQYIQQKKRTSGSSNEKDYPDW